ncbi:MAG: C-GCAxxG-C-C family protein [Dehalococcoidia bacterium]|nr:C-GCAxxG-C-C family protein [Dehalococcoidia bacterium]
MVVNLKRIRETAENYYRNGDYFCSEAIVRTIRDEFSLDYPDKVTAMASGFPVGMGYAGCACGAVVGGIMALGMAFGRSEPKDPKVKRTMELARELHDFFQAKHKVLCCRVHTQGLVLGSPEHMSQCIAFTGEVAEEVARLIATELNIKIADD